MLAGADRQEGAEGQGVGQAAGFGRAAQSGADARRRSIRAKKAFAQVTADWDQLLAAVEANRADLPEVEAFRVQLEANLEDLRPRTPGGPAWKQRGSRRRGCSNLPGSGEGSVEPHPHLGSRPIRTLQQQAGRVRHQAVP